MAIWTVLFIEFWKRETSKLQFEWDAIDFEKKMQPIRPQFELNVSGKKKNCITDEYEPHVSFSKRFVKYLMSFSIVILMVLSLLILD